MDFEPKSAPWRKNYSRVHIYEKNPLCLTGNRYLRTRQLSVLFIENVKFSDFCNFQVFGGICVQHAEQTESDRLVSPVYYDDWSAAVSLLFISRLVSVQQFSVWIHIVRWIVYSGR